MIPRVSDPPWAGPAPERPPAAAAAPEPAGVDARALLVVLAAVLQVLGLVGVCVAAGLLWGWPAALLAGGLAFVYVGRALDDALA